MHCSNTRSVYFCCPKFDSLKVFICNIDTPFENPNGARKLFPYIRANGAITRQQHDQNAKRKRALQTTQTSIIMRIIVLSSFIITSRYFGEHFLWKLMPGAHCCCWCFGCCYGSCDAFTYIVETLFMWFLMYEICCTTWFDVFITYFS